jgi:hypothetical protein
MPKNHLLRACALVLFSVASALGVTSCSSTSSQPAAILETVAVTGKVKHVWVVTLENQNYATTFGTSTKIPYLAQTLAGQGAMLQGYYGTGHVSLDNYVSMVSGQSGSVDTVADCQTYQDFTQTSTSLTGFGQIVGTGCVYPASVKTIADQLTAANLTWKGYMEDMGNDPTREAATCGHPALNAVDLTQTAEAPSASVPKGDQYATRHDPFMYFHSIIDSPDCATHVVPLTGLASDLAQISTTANVNFITPNLCDDGHDAPCVDGRPGGMTTANVFLQTLIPEIMASPAYQQDGLILINFDEGTYTLTVNSSGGYVLTFPGNACCGETLGPNLPPYPLTESLGSYTLVYGGFGGDNTGAVALSPFIKPGTVSTVQYNHFSMLRTLEDIFGLQQLGNAANPTLAPFGTDVFTNVH